MLDQETLVKVAKKAHELAIFAGERKGLKATKDGRRGWLISVNGGVSKFIKLAGDELKVHVINRTGQDGRKARGEVRDYLKSGKNVLVLHPGEKKYEWRLFISEEWSDGEVTTFRTLSHKMEHEVDKAMEGESGEVKISNLMDEFSSEPIGEQMALILRALERHGGSMGSPKSKTFVLNDVLGPDARPGDSPSGALRTLFHRELIKYESKGRRLQWVKLTARGQFAAAALPFVQTSEVAVAYACWQNNHMSPSKLLEMLPKISHRDEQSMMHALRSLEDSGLVEIIRSGDGPRAHYRGVKWIGGPFPGIMPDDDEKEYGVAGLPKAPPAVAAVGARTDAEEEGATVDTPDPVATDTDAQDATLTEAVESAALSDEEGATTMVSDTGAEDDLSSALNAAVRSLGNVVEAAKREGAKTSGDGKIEEALDVIKSFENGELSALQTIAKVQSVLSD